MSKEELYASEMLLDLGVSVQLRPLRFLGRFCKPRRVVLRRPYLGTLIAQARLYKQMNVTRDEMTDYTREQWLELMAVNGVTVSRLVACCITRGWLTHRLFNKVVAWWLRWRVHPDTLAELMLMSVSQINTVPFQTIIRSAEATNVMRPRLSQRSGS